MLNSYGGESYSGAMLQLVATAMHSNTQLVEDHPGHNDFIVDELVAESWEQKQLYDNAAAKYKEALAEVRSATIPSGEERSLELAYIYEELSDIAGKQHQYTDEIVFEKAAVMLGVTWDENYICHGYYMMKRYSEAVRACTDSIRDTGNPYARYWRSVAFWKAGKLDDALRDFAIVADSEGYYASYAAIRMSFIYGIIHEYKKSLDVLNKYTYLYDPSRVSELDIAIAYNNRCFANMKLGSLQKALDDCTQSLRHGSLPDAFRKQQELVKRLRERKGGN